MELLIVDDHPTNLKLLRAQLEAEGHAVFEAHDGVEALALLEHQPVDAVISDILMPNMDGYRLCHTIRASDRLRDLPLIVYTATYTSAGDEQLAYLVGADKYLLKPAPIQVLAQTLNELVNDARQQHPRVVQPPEEVVMREYNAALVRKLEERNEALERAHAQLEARNKSLAGALAEVRQAETQLLRSLGEKEVLLKEVHHRVKNNLQVISSLLNLQLSGTKNPELLDLLHANQARIRSMTLVHEHLNFSETRAEIDFAAFIGELTALLFAASKLPGASVALKLDLEPMPVGVDTAIPCALILNELVSNALKHAFPGGRSGEILVALHPGPAGQTLLTVRDDGVGLPQELDFRHTDSLGLQLVNILARQLRGTLELGHERGMRVTVSFPPRVRAGKDIVQPVDARRPSVPLTQATVRSC